jgi:hypothetical protein
MEGKFTIRWREWINLEGWHHFNVLIKGLMMICVFFKVVENLFEAMDMNIHMFIMYSIYLYAL